jgi:hypothetical protein
VVAADVERLGRFHERPDLGLLQMGELVFIRGGQVRAHGAVVIGDDDAAFSCRDGGLDVIFDV